MKILIALLFSSLLSCITVPAAAGSGHSHGNGHSHGPITKEQVIQKAVKRLKRLVKSGKLHQSWQGIKAVDALKKNFSGKKEWVVSFKNPNIKNESKQNLYMFFKLDGHYLATNYTGK